MSQALKPVFEFGPFRLETTERRLLRNGQSIALTPKEFETLLVLLQNAGHVVEKDDLMKRVWPDAHVQEANLTRNVWALRKALGDGGAESAYIETIPKLGYRFVASVTEPTNTSASVVPLPSPPKPRRVLLPLLLAILVMTGVMVAGFGWFRRSSEATVKSESGPTFLTDGSFADESAYWTNRGEIYFFRQVSTARSETWTMNLDGTNQHRANSQIKDLVHGHWSPDGKKVIFTKEDDDKRTYLADADGANEIVLPFKAGRLDWSPDGSAFVYQAKTAAGEEEIFLYRLETGTITSLTSNVASATPAFSYDGKQIAFTSFRDGNAEIYVMNADGTNVRRVTDHPAFDSIPVFSPDGTHVAFQSNRNDEHIELYLQNLNDDSPPIRLTALGSDTGFGPKCWSPDGTQMLVFTNRNGKNQIALVNVEPFRAQLLLSDDSADLSDPQLSTDGHQLLYEARLPDKSRELRITDLATKRTRRVFSTGADYPIYLSLSPVWSPDNSLIAFTARTGGNSEVLTIKTDGTGMENLTKHPLMDFNPVFSPNGREIVFARDTYGVVQLYRMDVNGANKRRITDRPGYEMTPAFSPDGAHLAFAGDRDNRGLDIFLLDMNKPGEEKRLLARRSHDGSPAFSPDGKRIVFIANGDGNAEIYVMNADGSGLSRITHTKAAEATPKFFSDGRRIVFSSNRSGKFALYQMPVR